MAVVRLSEKLEEKRAFIERVKAEAETDPRTCYQCGKCSAGCPISFTMDYQPRQIMRMVQLGLKEMALGSSAIWLCATCSTCTTRCPRGVKIAEVMDALRIMARREGYVSREPNVVKFHDAFLGSIRDNGRCHELGMIKNYKFATGTWFKDIELGRKMFSAGKISLRAHKIQGAGAIRRMYEKVNRMHEKAHEHEQAHRMEGSH